MPVESNPAGGPDHRDPPASLAKAVVEAFAGGGGRRKSDGPVAFLRTLTIVGACLAAAWQLLRTQQENYHELVQTIMKQSDEHQRQMIQSIDELKKSNQDLTETIRSAFYVREGADPPKKKRSNRVERTP
jgi:hypothetical protein